MVAIRESLANIDVVRQTHNEFTGKYVSKTIQFYIDIFQLLQTHKNRRTTSNRSFNIQVANIKNARECDNYRSLLKALLKKPLKIDNINHSHIIRDSRKRIIGANQFNVILNDLLKLSADYIGLLEMDFYNNASGFNLYLLQATAYPAIEFLLKPIFNYEDWFSKLKTDAEWGPYQLTEALQINSCPYCNRQYTYTIQTIDKQKISRPQLDHFFPMSKHPLLSLSFYNLIPSCANCNSSIKGAADITYFTHLNPYENNKSHHLCSFTYAPKTYAASVGLSDEMSITASYNGDVGDAVLKTKVEGNISLFFLNDVYHNHRDVVQEIIRKRHISNDTYISTLQKTFHSFNIGLKEAYQLAYGNFYNESEFIKRPLSKLTRDIAVELDALLPAPGITTT